MHDVVDIESLDLSGRGIAHREGKVVFVEGALPGEQVRIHVHRQKDAWDLARATHILRASSQRVQPPCPNFGLCGGCAMQHLDVGAQVAIKQRALEDAFTHIGHVRPGRILPALHGPAWAYRHRARLSIRLVSRKGAVLVGFRERKGRFVADMTECHVLPPRVSALLQPLRELFGSMSQPHRLPQVEVSVGAGQVVFLLRHLSPLSTRDLDLLREFGKRHEISWWLQPGRADTMAPLIPEDADRLAYELPEFGLRMRYRPGDFTQVNDMMNRSMVSQAVRLLEPQTGDRVADLFCGLGNFSLPLATRAREVVGVEGSAALTERARGLAAEHGLEERTRFETADLFRIDGDWLRSLRRFDRMLIDPPREGAEALARALAGLPRGDRPVRIVYISCNPSSLARDAGILVHEGGYRLLSAGVINMFPHTAHVESMAVFE